MKYIVSILAVSIFLFSCGSNHKPGTIVKRDTIIGQYITAPYGGLQGGPAIRTISYALKTTTSDSITFKRSVVLDTTAMIFPSVPTMDSVTKKPKKDSLGNQEYHVAPATIPGRFVIDTHIPTH